MSDTTANPAGPSDLTGRSAAPDLRGRTRPGESVIKAVLVMSAGLSVLITAGIILALIRPVIDFFREIPFGDFFATEGQFAVIPLITGTLMVTAIALLLAVPLGLGAAGTSEPGLRPLLARSELKREKVGYRDLANDQALALCAISASHAA